MVWFGVSVWIGGVLCVCWCDVDFVFGCADLVGVVGFTWYLDLVGSALGVVVCRCCVGCLYMFGMVGSGVGVVA